MLEETDIGGSAAVRVPVSPALPLLTAQLEAAGLTVAAVPESARSPQVRDLCEWWQQYGNGGFLNRLWWVGSNLICSYITQASAAGY